MNTIILYSELILLNPFHYESFICVFSLQDYETKTRLSIKALSCYLCDNQTEISFTLSNWSNRAQWWANDTEYFICTSTRTLECFSTPNSILISITWGLQCRVSWCVAPLELGVKSLAQLVSFWSQVQRLSLLIHSPPKGIWGICDISHSG